MVDLVIKVEGYRFKASDVISYYDDTDYEYGYDHERLDTKNYKVYIDLKRKDSITIDCGTFDPTWEGDDEGIENAQKRIGEILNTIDRQMDEYQRLVNEFNIAKVQSGGFNRR